MADADADTPTPHAAAAALAELTRRREQVVAEHAAGPPAWELPLTMALTFAEWATRDLEGTRHHRSARTAVHAAAAAAALVRRGDGSARVPVDPAWLTHALAPREEPSVDAADDDDLDDASGDDAAADVWSAQQQRGCGATVLLLTIAALVPGRLAARLRQRGVRHPNTITAAVAALTLPPVMRLAQRGLVSAADRARLLPDVAAVESFPPELAPAPVFEPRYGDPALLPLLGLLAPAGSVRDSFLREAIGVDDARLEQQLAPLVAAGFVERRRAGWMRPGRTSQLTPRGRAAIAAHAAALRAIAA